MLIFSFNACTDQHLSTLIQVTFHLDKVNTIKAIVSDFKVETSTYEIKSLTSEPSSFRCIKENKLEFLPGCHVIVQPGSVPKSMNLKTHSDHTGVVLTCNRTEIEGVDSIVSMYVVKLDHSEIPIAVGKYDLLWWNVDAAHQNAPLDAESNLDNIQNTTRCLTPESSSKSSDSYLSSCPEKSGNVENVKQEVSEKGEFQSKTGVVIHPTTKKNQTNQNLKVDHVFVSNQIVSNDEMKVLSKSKVCGFKRSRSVAFEENIATSNERMKRVSSFKRCQSEPRMVKVICSGMKDTRNKALCELKALQADRKQRSFSMPRMSVYSINDKNQDEVREGSYKPTSTTKSPNESLSGRLNLTQPKPAVFKRSRSVAFTESANRSDGKVHRISSFDRGRSEPRMIKTASVSGDFAVKSVLSDLRPLQADRGKRAKSMSRMSIEDMRNGGVDRAKIPNLSFESPNLSSTSSSTIEFPRLDPNSIRRILQNKNLLQLINRLNRNGNAISIIEDEPSPFISIKSSDSRSNISAKNAIKHKIVFETVPSGVTRKIIEDLWARNDKHRGFSSEWFALKFPVWFDVSHYNMNRLLHKVISFFSDREDFACRMNDKSELMIKFYGPNPNARRETINRIKSHISKCLIEDNCFSDVLDKILSESWGKCGKSCTYQKKIDVPSSKRVTPKRLIVALSKASFDKKGLLAFLSDYKSYLHINDGGFLISIYTNVNSDTVVKVSNVIRRTIYQIFSRFNESHMEDVQRFIRRSRTEDGDVIRNMSRNGGTFEKYNINAHFAVPLNNHSNIDSVKTRNNDTIYLHDRDMDLARSRSKKVEHEGYHSNTKGLTYTIPITSRSKANDGHDKKLVRAPIRSRSNR